mgnify:CR=1 FL=1
MKKKILSLLAAFFMLFGTSAMAQVDSTLEGDVNGDGVVDIADITAVIAIIKQNAEANPTYYWYAGWTIPTAENIATIVNETYPNANKSTVYNPAGKSSTTLAGTVMDFSKNPIYDQEAINNKQKRDYYIVVPNGYGIYSTGLNMFVHNDSGTFNKIGEFTNHTVYKFIQNASYMINMWKLCEIK